ncbi:hypothetical protein ACWOFR_00590 [Carnobacterium gallinarum]|uniref:hypothetical protein n=1 Tax=Carnobacterium gallinarum TaxID=2749 RepID=UPI000550E568|nr:hypothetical protein [Carnobacterium gallinarum]
MKKYTIFSLLFLVSLLSLVIYQSFRPTEVAQVENRQQSKVNDKKLNHSMVDDFDLNVFVETDSIYDFETVHEISEATDVMIKGKVISETSQTIDLNDGEPQAITLLKVEIVENLKGDFAVGQEVYFIEPGGVVSAGELDIPKKTFEKTGNLVDPSTQVRVLFDGVANTQTGAEVVFFAVPIIDDFYQLNLNELYYSTIAGSQGRFILNEDQTEFISPKTEEIVVEEMQARGVSSEKEPLVIKNNSTVLEALAKE